jgi:putative methionine-R-sulfoxide reductase with GAF domain
MWITAHHAGADATIITGHLATRPTRAPDSVAEREAIGLLHDALASSPKEILDALVIAAKGACRCGSAGISIVENDLIHSHALVGHLGTYKIPPVARGSSVCGLVVDSNQTMLFSVSERTFGNSVEGEPAAWETLISPFSVAETPVGTLWVVSHEHDDDFDAEDARLLGKLAQFASVAYQLRGDLIAASKAEDDASKKNRLAYRAVAKLMAAQKHPSAEDWSVLERTIEAWREAVQGHRRASARLAELQSLRGGPSKQEEGEN